MREIIKNPMLYYLLIPVLVGTWPLLVAGVYLPRAEHDLEVEKVLCGDAQARVEDILAIDPDRPIRKIESVAPAEFQYTPEVDRVASLCKIPASNWVCQATKIMPSGNKKRRDANVKLTNIGIVQAATFLSEIQSKWPNRLTCDSAKLQKKKGMLDQWDVEFNFVYYY